MYNDNRSVGISLPGIFDFFRISRWQYWHHKSTIEKHLGGEHDWNFWHTHPVPRIHSHRTQPSHTNTLFVLLVVFGRNNSLTFASQVLFSSRIIVLQKFFHVCPSWSHHFGWREEGRKNTIVTGMVQLRIYVMYSMSVACSRTSLFLILKCKWFCTKHQVLTWKI